jgi:hypothetical protein
MKSILENPQLKDLEGRLQDVQEAITTQGVETRTFVKAALPPSEFWSSPFFDRESYLQHLQRAITNQWMDWRAKRINPLNHLSEAGFRAYSQFEEDGIILYLLTMTGFKTKTVVEICCGDGRECMATNLVLNHGFDGYMFDGDAKNIEYANIFFNLKRDCLLFKPALRHAWVTRENVNQLLEESGVSGEVDLLSLDIDGNDYWVWEAIDVITPRICVFETQSLIPSDLALTIKYDPYFNYLEQPRERQDYRSGSLAAMAKLSAKKGYRLIGSHSYGFNVFFMRDDIAPDLFPEVPVDVIHNNPRIRLAQRKGWPAVKDLEWVTV